jgi:hypothetical protein
MFEGLVHVQPLKLRLLTARDNVDVVTAPQAVVEDTQKAIAVRGVIHANSFTPAGQCIVHKSGCLMTETVVIVSPCMACQQNAQGCEWFAPREIAALLQPFGMLR